jgi:lipopolysaccharide transport system permease protein
MIEDTVHPSTRAMPVLRLDNRPEPLRAWLGALWRYRSVLVALARKDFKVRYKRASLGALWAIAFPLLQATVLVFVFSRVGRFGQGQHFNYAGFVLAGTTMWFNASSAIGPSTTSIVDSSSLTDKVWFPRALLPLVPVASNLISLAISLVVLIIALPLVGQALDPRLSLLLPACALLIAFTAALGLVLGALYVYFRDVKFMVQAVLLVLFYVTPIVYPESALHQAGRWLDFNPFTGIVGLFQRAAVGAAVPSGRALAVSIIATVVLGVVGLGVQRRHDRLFVDLL